jgi:tetratricopeptide (TPR) repeat protein
MTHPEDHVTDAPVKHDAEVTQQEIDAVLDLSAQREFSKSLALFQEMLPRAKDANNQRKILFGIVTCSTWLKLDTTREGAIQDLKQLSDFEVSYGFVVMAQATAYIDFGRVQEALDLINENLRTELLQRDDFQDWKYDHLFSKGRALVKLARYDEALRVFDAAHGIFPEGNSETEMLIERANCLIALDRFEETYDTAHQVLSRGDQEMATLAMQYMAECRMWQSRVPEALKWYAAIQKRLPCRWVQEERIQKGITNAIAYLEKLHPQGRPS